MSNILPFKPKHAKQTEKNLADFIQYCRDDLKVFGSDLKWDENYWKPAGASFAEYGKRAYGGQLPAELMQQPYLDFAKAYFRYIAGTKPSKGNLQTLSAIKAIELGLRTVTGSSKLEDINTTVLDTTLEIVYSKVSKQTAYHVGRNMMLFVEFISEKQLIPSYLEWTSPVRQPITNVRTGKKAEARRQKKMPDTNLLDIIGEIFSKDLTNPRDIITTSVVAILLSAPSRISEVLSLREDCEVWETDSSGKQVYGLRFWPGKEGLPELKHIPDPFVDIVQLAINRLKKLTSTARKMAKWYEENPSQLYPHEGLPKVDIDQKLSIHEACMALGLKQYKSSKSTIHKYGFKQRDYTLRNFGKYAELHLPRNFPWFDEERKVKYSEALFCLQKHTLHHVFNSSPIRIENALARQRINHDLNDNKGLVVNNIFVRHGYNIEKKDDKNSKRLRTHAIRHLINTMAQKGGLSQYDLARWSGRKSVHQNKTYDHMSEYEMLNLLTNLDKGSLELFGPMAEIARKLPMTTQEFNNLIIPTAHITEYGFCIHDYTMEPCQKFRDCLNCTEHVCIKGDNVRLKRLKEKLTQVTSLIEKAENEISSGTYGADRHYEHLKLTHARLSQLIKILQSEKTSNGAVIKLSNDKEFSPFKLALQQRNINKNNMDDKMLQDVSDLLGQ